MSFARTWLWIALAAGACSSRGAEERGAAATGSAGSAGSAAGSAAAAPADDRYDPGALGALAFPMSEGTPAARAAFTRGLLALHSFWYDEAKRQFWAAIAADPEMNMAYWGVAMSHLKLLWGDDDLGAARKVMSRMPDPDRLPPREQAWVMAGVELVRAGDVRTSRQRFAAAMEALHRDFPDDESATFLAVALLATTRPEDPDHVAVRKRAAALALEVFQRNPRHPGAAHYLIHAYDTPELAALALPQAREYARIAPAAFHARHMPAHIFSRLGMWREAIASCWSAWEASLAAARREKLSANHHDFHSLNWLVEMAFEVGQRKEADRALGLFADAVRAGLGRQHRATYATQVASYMARTGEWARVDELLAPLDAPAVEDPTAPALTTMPAAPAAPAAGSAAAPAAPTAPGTGSSGSSAAGADDRRGGAPSHCAPAPAASPLEQLEQLAALDARARAAAWRKDLPATRRLADQIDALRAKLRPFFESTQPKDALARIDAAHARRRQALLARAAGDDRALLDVLRRSTADAAPEQVGEANPSGFLLHEEIGDTLLRLGRAKEAAAEYALALRAVPGRARALLGSARAAAAAGDAAAARRAYEALAQQWSAADEGTDGLAEARAAIAAAAPAAPTAPTSPATPTAPTAPTGPTGPAPASRGAR